MVAGSIILYTLLVGSACVCVLYVCACAVRLRCQVESLTPLLPLPALGHLNISNTRVGVGALHALRGLHILELQLGLFGSGMECVKASAGVWMALMAWWVQRRPSCGIPPWVHLPVSTPSPRSNLPLPLQH